MPVMRVRDIRCAPMPPGAPLEVRARPCLLLLSGAPRRPCVCYALIAGHPIHLRVLHIV